ncbi:hypothetical protein D5086_027229 [Populus alba]|uniref:Uncharacterized protein n=1 Tax=Populus alba TaxID=43335 RepID=A0ACC4AUT0_POPAL
MGSIAAIQYCAITAILLVSTIVSSDDKSPIPADPSSLNTWFQDNVKPLADQYGTVYSATLEAEADYFVAANVIFKNSASRPNGELKGEQAVALRIAGDKSAFYNCRFIGFQDTLCDDKGRHLFKNCYIEGTVDYIFWKWKVLVFEYRCEGEGANPAGRAKSSKQLTPDQAAPFISLGFIEVRSSIHLPMLLCLWARKKLIDSPVKGSPIFHGGSFFLCVSENLKVHITATRVVRVAKLVTVAEKSLSRPNTASMVIISVKKLMVLVNHSLKAYLYTQRSKSNTKLRQDLMTAEQKAHVLSVSASSEDIYGNPVRGLTGHAES